MCLYCRGYAAFNATEGDKNDGSESCVATITANLGGPTAFSGSTGAQHGHAEMDALYKLLVAVNWDPIAFAASNPVVECDDKACCLGCSAVLGLLGVAARPNTQKSAAFSKGPAYGLPPDVRDFIYRYVVAHNPLGLGLVGNIRETIQMRFTGGGKCK
jgi:hypothetical protein